MSGPGIFLIRDDGELVEMMEEAYDSERRLQMLLARHPNLLAGGQINSLEPRRWLLVRREAPLPVEEGSSNWFSVDHLFLDQDGIPTLVEVKRSSDTRIRREVVGQLLDYAANAVLYWPVETIRNHFEERCAREGDNPDRALDELLLGESPTEEFWSRVKTNLLAGRIRLVFVADVIPGELQRIVEFLNQQMDPAEVLAIEIRQYVGDDLRTLVPRVIGLPAKAVEVTERRRWDEAAFFGALRAAHGDRASDAARHLLYWARDRGLRLWWGQGKQLGSFMPIVDHKGVGHTFIAVWSNGYLELQFQHMRLRPPFDSEDSRREFCRMINHVPGANVPEDAIARRPSLPLDLLTTEEARKALMEAMDWFVKQVRDS